MKILHCIGDSHVNIFNGRNGISTGGEYPYSGDVLSHFKTYNIGPAIAYNLREGHKWSNSINGILSKIPKHDYILFSFGMIDCAYHLPKQKIRQSDREYSDIIKECVDIYFNLVKEVMDKGYSVIVYGPVVPTRPEVPLHNYDDKIFAVKLFTDYMSELVENESNIIHIQMYDTLLDENDETKTEYYLETVHLNDSVLPLVLQKLKSKGIEWIS